ncbi:hypothetical protein E1301_Tti000040 [Triplophysa tibetana]|uniref:Uncharacterized protein n=1 Tax=Triplophysa tibetana TaxID=1572043 RepID=A0A5A9N553_9TELE|nr:hypothetical protein E1301_Tti000040 [Triplophysa tibetana]
MCAGSSQRFLRVIGSWSRSDPPDRISVPCLGSSVKTDPSCDGHDQPQNPQKQIVRRSMLNLPQAVVRGQACRGLGPPLRPISQWELSVDRISAACFHVVLKMAGCSAFLRNPGLLFRNALQPAWTDLGSPNASTALKCLSARREPDLLLSFQKSVIQACYDGLRVPAVNIHLSLQDKFVMWFYKCAKDYFAAFNVSSFVNF